MFGIRQNNKVRVVRCKCDLALPFIAQVYHHRIGTDHGADNFGPEEFTPVLPAAELLEERPHRAELNGTPIVLVRSADRVFALGEKCGHLGGPLSEGPYKNGVIQCPWHGSQFSMSDGRVVHGPSVHPQVCFDARIRGGQVEVRRHVELPKKRHRRGEEAA